MNGIKARNTRKYEADKHLPPAIDEYEIIGEGVVPLRLPGTVRGSIQTHRRLVEGECQLPGEWDYLSAFRHTETRPVPADEAVFRSLRRRLTIVEESGVRHMRVPLMRRWLRDRG